MRHIYTCLVLFITGMFLPLAAEAAKVTLNIDNPDAVSLQLSTSGPVETKSQVVIDYEPNSYPSLYISAKTNYKVTVVDQNNNNYPASYGSISLYLSTATDGNVYTVTTVNLEEKRTATAHVKVVGSPSSIGASRNGGESFTLVEGDNEIKFIPGEESPFTFNNYNYTPFYRIAVDGEQKTMSGSSISVDVVDGTKIEIEPAFPQIPVELTITVPEDVTGIVTNVMANYNTVEGWKVNAPFEVSAGSQISVQLDDNNYKLDAIYLDGVQQSTTSYFSFTIGTEPTEVKIDAHNYGNYSYTLNIDNPERVVVYEGTSTYGATPMQLVAGDNALTISEKVGKILIKATTGNDIASITDADGNALTLTYGALEIKDNMYVKVTTQERAYDGAFIVYVNNINEVATSYDGSLSAYWATENDRDTKNFLQEGYNTVKFSTVANEQHMVQIGTKTTPYIAYFNGVLQENNYGSQYYTWYGNPKQDDVIKVFTDGAPNEYTVHISTTGSAAADVKVTVDMVTPVAEIADADVKVLAGTIFTVTPPANANVSVNVDNSDLTADENGKFSFAASGNHSVNISASSGVENISTDALQNSGAVYNLQGIKVLDDCTDLKHLPAGIYIVNGKKYVVR